MGISIQIPARGNSIHISVREISMQIPISGISIQIIYRTPSLETYTPIFLPSSDRFRTCFKRESCSTRRDLSIFYLFDPLGGLLEISIFLGRRRRDFRKKDYLKWPSGDFRKKDYLKWRRRRDIFFFWGVRIPDFDDFCHTPKASI